MKKPIMWVAALLTASCTPALKVEVANTTPTERDDETVEIAWSEVAALKGVTPDNIVVLNDDNEQIPSQVLFRGGTEPQALIFQTDADPMESKRFKLVAGQRENYPAEAFGRTVPERYDDYAWENNKVAYRLYGPALETSPEKLVTPGIDVWVKCTDKLVIDEWYARGNYHHNYGDGMDCYKVGVTLGSGASLPFAGGKFWMMGHNYATARTLDNGPIRTSVELTYAPFDVDGTPVTLTKIISLDANQRFNRMDNIYEGAFAEMPIAAGFVRHDVKQMQRGEGWMALCEAVSDSKDPVRDGDIYLGVILPGAEMLTDTLGHAVAVKAVKPGRTLTYYAGSGWSQGGVEDMKEWIEEIGQAQAAAGYAAAMRATFNIDDDGSLSKFGDQDLRADMDSVIVGSKVTQDTDLADALRSYYENLTEYDRAKEFISLSFGTQDTSNSSFADAVYRALLDDSGMQLLFYMNGMWSVNGWQIKEDYAPAVRGAADLFAEYLAGAVNHEKVKSETNDRLVAMGGQALSDALAALGDSDAAAAALAAANELADGTQSAVSSGSDAISAARDTLQTKFDVKIFQLILLIAAAVAAFMLVFSMVMFVVHRKEN